MTQREVLDHRAAEVATEQHHLFVAEDVVHEGVQVAGVAGDVVEPVRSDPTVAEAAQVGHDHLEPGSRQRFDHLPEDALALRPPVHTHERHTTEPFSDVGQVDIAHRRAVDGETGRIDMGGHLVHSAAR